MKKSILALAILASGSASAAINLYDAEGIKVDVSGAAEVQLNKSRVNFANGEFYNEDLKFRLDDGNLAFNTVVEINEELSALGTASFDYEKKEVKSGDLFIGLKHTNFGTVTIGRQATLVDASGISNDIEGGFGFKDPEGDSIDLFLVTSGDEVLKYKLDGENYWLGASYAQNNQEAYKVERDAIDLGAGVTFGDVTLSAYYQTAGAKSLISKFTQDTYQLEASYKLDALNFATSYSASELSGGTDTLDLEVVKLTTAYTMDKTTFAVGADFGKASADGESIKVNNYYANVTNKLTDNVKVYGEISMLDSDELEAAAKASKANIDLGYVVGMEVKF